MSTLAAIVVLVAILILAKHLIIPIVLAAFASFLLAPLVERLEKRGVNRVVSVLAVVAGFMAPLIAVGWVVIAQFISVAMTLPQYQSNIARKIDALQGPVGRLIARINDAVSHMSGIPETAPGVTPVTVVSPPLSPYAIFSQYAGTILSPLAIAGIMLVFVIFFLLQREDLRDRLIRVVSHGRITSTTSALDEFSDRLGRFLRTQFLVNTGVGILIGAGLAVLGVPNAVLWGFLAAALRYVPYVGPIAAGSIPVILTLAINDGWQKPIEVAAFIIVSEVVINNFIEPFFYGSTTGVSATALLVAAVFWGGVWGIPGLLLATPLTVCLVIVGRHVPQLSFFHVLLGDQPVLTPQEKLYQRLVAMDSDEAADIADEYLKAHSLVELYDNLFLPVLRTASREVEDGMLDQRRFDFFLQAMHELVEDATNKSARQELQRIAALNENGTTPVQPPVSRPAIERLRILCIPARDGADAVAGLMIESLGASLEIGVRALSTDDLGTDLQEIVREYNPDYILISSVPPHASTRARARGKIARRRVPTIPFIGGVWGLGAEVSLRERLVASGFESVVGSMSEAAALLRKAATKGRNAPLALPA